MRKEQNLKSIGEILSQRIENHPFTPQDLERIRGIAYGLWVGRGNEPSSPEQKERDWKHAEIVFAAKGFK